MLVQETTDRRPLRRIFIAPRWNVAAVTTIVFLFLFLSGVQAYRWYEQRLIREQRAEVRSELALLGNTLSLAIDRRLNLIGNLDTLIRANPAVDSLEEVLAPTIAGLAASTPGIRAIVIAPEGGARYVHPQTDGSRQLAQELYENPPAMVAAGARRALETGAATASAPIMLPDEQWATVIQQAIYIEGRLWGFVTLVNDLQPILANGGLGLGADPFQIAIADADGNPIYGQVDLQAQEPASHFIAFSGGGWQLAALPRDGWTAAINSPLRVFATLTFALILLATGMVYLVRSRQANHTAVAIENARLLKLEQRRSEQFRLIGEVSQQITAILARDEVANQAAYLIQQAFGFSHVHIGLVEDDAVVFRASAGVWRDQRECHYCGKHAFKVGKVGASGVVASSGEPYVVANVRQDSFYLPMDEEQVGSALILPLKVRREIIGVLNIERDVVAGFDGMDVGVLQPLANQLAIALENARLYERGQALAALQERQKLARELHDSVSQALYGIGLGAKTAIKLIETENADKNSLAPPLDYVLSLATTGLAEMRALIFELRPESLEVEGLIPALTRRVEAVRARHEILVETTLEIEPDVPVGVKEVLYRFTQEALHNVVKHASARHAHVRLADENGNVVVEVSDDGRGFEPGDHFPGHLGLQSMRERVEGVGGVFIAESAPGQGATIRATIPRTGGLSTG